MDGIIYCYRNIINNKLYVGKTTKCLETRHVRHIKLCENGSPQSNTLLYRAMRKYGIDKFQLDMLEIVPAEELNRKEHEWIQKLNSHYTKGGYNMTWGGDGGPCSESGRKRIGEANRTRIITEATKQKFKKNNAGESNPFFGKHHSKKSKNKISDAKGMKWIIYPPDEAPIQITSLRRFCNENNLDTGALHKVSQGKASHHKGFCCETLTK